MRVPRHLPALALLGIFPLLLPSGAQENGSELQVWVHPPNPLILSGDSVVLNCSTNCPTQASIGLETRLPKSVEDQGTNWKTFRLRNVTRDDSPFCFVNCPTKNQSNTRTHIMVYEPPRKMKLDLEPSQEQSWIPVGQNFSVSCQVTGGRPRENLKMVLRRGDQEISSQLVPKNTLDTAFVKFYPTASREDNEANFSCHASLDLRPKGLKLYQNSSVPRKLYTFALAPEPPVLVAPKLLEAGTKEQVSCEMDKLFPVEKAHIRLTWGGQVLTQVDVTQHADVLRATATIMAAAEEGEADKELTCSVSLGGETRTKSENLTVYIFPQPSLVASGPIQEGNRVNLTCEARSRARVQINGAPPDEPNRISLIVGEKDNGRLFTCQAFLKLREETLQKNRSLELNVQFPPKLDEECPGNWNWQEGTEQTLRCAARGNPAPTVQCVPESQQNGMPLGLPHRVTRDHNGTYHCTAENSLGKAVKVVTVNVEFQDVNWTPIVISILVFLFVASVLISLGYLYYRQQRIRSYELRKAEEERNMKLINSEVKA
ncbi:intercellular adhesion molecule 1 isoform X2 [Gracilinanus agilis]|uniref:intercellular adhesion molecule 1 isoform X2 n=1 Tax=Gracilinanus agilis TaxID=191870 RepID=UPI001CFF0714|nr:intercellular adhesion molecule 1 isoform X2 [Gracilinanus agilis]